MTIEDELIDIIKNNDTMALEILFEKHPELDNIDYHKIYTNICDIDNPISHYVIGYYYQSTGDTETDKILYHYQLSAEGNFSRAFNNLGSIYQNGNENGIEINYQKALHYYQKAIDLDCSSALNNIGLMYYQGIGVDRDLDKAIYFYSLAFKKDPSNMALLINIAHSYHHGNGVDKDYAMALQYYQKPYESKEPIKEAEQNIDDLFAGKDFKSFILKEFNEMKQRIKELEIENIELKYRPGGVGYQEAKNEFDGLSNNYKN